jgi:hypothetical protein
MANTIRMNEADSWNPARAFEELNAVRLEDAVLCANCEVIVSEMLKGKCPVCGSSALMGLSRLLGGTLQRPGPKPFLQKPLSANVQPEARAS